MPTPIITLPIHTIEQARALSGLLRAFIDGQSPDTNDGQDWKPDAEYSGMVALWCHLDAAIKAGDETSAEPNALPLRTIRIVGKSRAYHDAGNMRKGGAQVTVCNVHGNSYDIKVWKEASAV